MAARSAGCAPRHRGAPGHRQTARFFSLRRSRSERPPQMPKRSSFISADFEAVVPHLARQADLLGLPCRSTLFGEERLGVGLRAQCALLPPRSSASPSRRKSSLTALALSTRYCIHPALPPASPSPYRKDRLERAKNTVGITCLSYTGSQAGIWYGGATTRTGHATGVSAAGPTLPLGRGSPWCVKICPMRNITVLSGGIGGARFLQGLLHGLGTGSLPGDRRRRRGHRRRQHRRRPVGPRAEGLPRPRHGDVHPRATASTPSAAGGGARRPGACAPSSRSTAWSRPGSGSATGTWPPTWCAPRCSTPASPSPR